jgi:hypothetical protein
MSIEQIFPTQGQIIAGTRHSLQQLDPLLIFSDLVPYRECKSITVKPHCLNFNGQFYDLALGDREPVRNEYVIPVIEHDKHTPSQVFEDFCEQGQGRYFMGNEAFTLMGIEIEAGILRIVESAYYVCPLEFALEKVGNQRNILKEAVYYYLG